MNSTLHSFMDIFETTFIDGQEAVQLQKIIIPIIQRDYAQGRHDPEIDRIRSRFLASLCEAVENKPITLDFVYGDINEDGVMTPLDGQQRLTTLFLESLFSCKWDLIDCALMSIGDYGQQERNKWRWQYASKSMQLAWDGLFHKSANTGFDKTKEILIQLLSKSESFTNENLMGIRDEFISTCESNNLYPWRYYYVKYDTFRPGSYGKYSNSDVLNKPYMFSVLQTRSQWSSNTYMPYLKEADEAHLSKDSLGQRLVYGDCHVICSNSSYILRDNETETTIRAFPIRQNEEGIDVEDRILLLKKLIATKELFEEDAVLEEQGNGSSADAG